MVPAARGPAALQMTPISQGDRLLALLEAQSRGGSVINKFQKSEYELKACVDAVDSGKASSVRALSELEPGTYYSLLRIISNPSDAVHDMTVDERKAESKRLTRDTNRVLREFRECKRKYRKRFGDG